MRASTHLFICARAQWRTYVSARPTRVRVRATTVSPSSAPPPPLILLNIRSRAAARSSQSSLESRHQQGTAADQQVDGPMRGGGWEDVTSHQQKKERNKFLWYQLSDGWNESGLLAAGRGCIDASCACASKEMFFFYRGIENCFKSKLFPLFFSLIWLKCTRVTGLSDFELLNVKRRNVLFLL